MATIGGHDEQRRALLRRRRRIALRAGGRHNQQARVNEAIFIFAISAAAALIEISSPNISADHHSKAFDVSVFSILIAFCSSIASIILPRRQARLIRAPGIAAISVAVAFSSLLSMVLPHKISWTPYIACAFPLYNLFPRPFVWCFDFLSRGFSSIWRMIAREIQRLKTSLRTQNRSTSLQPINQNVEMLEV